MVVWLYTNSRTERRIDPIYLHKTVTDTAFAFITTMYIDTARTVIRDIAKARYDEVALNGRADLESVPEELRKLEQPLCPTQFDRQCGE